MADTKISALPATTTITDDDLLCIVDDPGGVPITKKIAVADFLSTANIPATNINGIPPSGNFAAISSVLSGVGGITCFDTVGNYVYAGTLDGNFLVVDITDPSSPVAGTPIFISANPITAIKVKGQYVFMADGVGGSVSILDISNPVFPGVVATFAGSYNFLDMAINGNYVYLAEASGLIVTLYVVNEFTPFLIPSLSQIAIASTNLSVPPNALTIQDGYLYAACSNGGVDDGLQVFSIFDPFTATYVATYSIPTTVLSGVAAVGRYVYVTEGAGGGNNVYIVDVLDPTVPVLASSLNVAPTYSLYYRATISGRFLCLTDANNGGFIVDVADPTTPVIVYDFTVTNLGLHNINYVAMVGGLVLVGYEESGTGYLDIFTLQSLEVAGIKVASLDSGEATVRQNLKVGQTLEVTNSINAGKGGIATSGDLSGSTYNKTMSIDKNGTTLKGDINILEVDQPPNTGTASLVAVAGSVDNGDHDYKITFVTNTGGETAASLTPSPTVTVVNNAVAGRILLDNLPISSDIAVVNRRLYRRFNSTGTWKRHPTLLDNISTTFTDNTANASLTTDAPAADDSSRTTIRRLAVSRRLLLTLGGAVAANDLVMPLSNTATITGNTQINAITTSGWVNGSTITLIFSGTPTVKHNTAGGAGTLPIKLAGSLDFAAAADSVLQLVKTATFWQEVSRKVA